MRVPCVIFEDEHLLVVNKPPGWNTHAPSPYAGEGLYDWLRHREPRWAKLAIIHRLDKETSGVIVFSKSTEANRSLTKQFEEGTVRKKYAFMTDRKKSERALMAKSCLVRAEKKYVSRPVHAGAAVAETRFRLSGLEPQRRQGRGEEQLEDLATVTQWEAEPQTGRTHQIRVHAADNGIPILGDVLYGGTPERRVFLHATEIRFRHPGTGEDITFRARADFDSDPRRQLRTALIDFECADSYRIIHGASDGWPGWYMDRLGEFVLSQGETVPSAEQVKKLVAITDADGVVGIYRKDLVREIRKTARAEATPKLVHGKAAPERFVVLENSVRFELSFGEGYSVGIFLDQRDNRRRILTGHVDAEFPLYPEASGREVLNTFAYTCAFSVCAAKAGARVTSLDLSKKYLEWGKRNFELNQIDASQHDFIYGDAFDWMRRLAKKGRKFDLVLIDPPTFSQSKEFGIFRAEKDYGKLVQAALPLLKAGGVLFCSSNAERWKPEDFLATIRDAIASSRRNILQEKYFPQPPDFPISRGEPAYLKTVWMRLATGRVS